MPECLCPNCQTLFKASSSIFGENYHCTNCEFEFKLDVIHLARFQLPQTIHISLLNSEGTPFTNFSVPIMIEYGFRLPPLKSNSFGEVTVTRELFLKAQRDEISTGIMDHKGDYSLNRFVRIKVLGRTEASKLAEMRKNSGWSILDLEKELYGKMESLLSAYLPDGDVIPTSAMIDLLRVKDVVELALTVTIV